MLEAPGGVHRVSFEILYFTLLEGRWNMKECVSRSLSWHRRAEAEGLSAMREEKGREISSNTVPYLYRQTIRSLKGTMADQVSYLYPRASEECRSECGYEGIGHQQFDHQTYSSQPSAETEAANVSCTWPSMFSIFYRFV